MPLAHEVATELRKFADSLDRVPDAEVSRPFMNFGRDYLANDKERFLSIARFMPRPIKKEYTDRELKLNYESPALYIFANIDRADVCELVEPAKPAVYRCDPILSDDEVESLEAVNEPA